LTGLKTPAVRSPHDCDDVMNPPLSVLLAEDDATLGSALATALRAAGYEVEWVRDGQTAYARAQRPDLGAVLLDLGLPEISGLDLLHRLRQKNPDLPVLVVTAYGELRDRVRGLDLGADDYITKPFAVEELLARLRAATRRHRQAGESLLRVRDVELDPRSHRVRQAGQEVWLTGREFAVLKLLMENVGRPVSRERIEQHLYGWGEVVEANTVDVFIYNLRRKLSRDLIYTYRGHGYSIDG
jgi:DNA-binding response OmpR family regulator